MHACIPRALQNKQETAENLRAPASHFHPMAAVAFRTLRYIQNLLLRRIRAVHASNSAAIGQLWDELEELSLQLEAFQGSRRQRLALGREEQRLYRAFFLRAGLHY